LTCYFINIILTVVKHLLRKRFIYNCFPTLWYNYNFFFVSRKLQKLAFFFIKTMVFKDFYK